MAPPLKAEVALYPIAGTSVVDTDEAVAAADAGEYVPSEEVLADAARRLAEHGVDIVEAGPTTIVISGDADRFDEVFGVRGPDDGEPRIPDGLSDVVAGVTFLQ